MTRWFSLGASAYTAEEMLRMSLTIAERFYSQASLHVANKEERRAVTCVGLASEYIASAIGFASI